jgi:hypothetical protein
MRVLTAKEVNFVSGGEIYTDHPTHLNAGSNSDVSWCPKPSENNDSKGGYLGTGMPCTSGNSIGDVNYLPPTQEEACENANQMIVGGGGLLGAASGLGHAGIPASVPVGIAGGAAVAIGSAISLGNGC